mgnify:FL=1
MSRSSEESAKLDLAYDQDLFLVVGGEGEDAQMLTEDDHLVVFESLWHAGPLIHELRDLGVPAHMVMMPLDGFYYLAEGLDMDLWVLRHDGTVASVDGIVFEQKDDTRH